MLRLPDSANRFHHLLRDRALKLDARRSGVRRMIPQSLFLEAAAFRVKVMDELVADV